MSNFTGGNNIGSKSVGPVFANQKAAKKFAFFNIDSDPPKRFETALIPQKTKRRTVFRDVGTPDDRKA